MPRLGDMSCDAKQARAAIFRSAALGVGFAAFQNDGRNGAERFDVINDGRAAVEADDSREGRLDARITALAFERFHQRGFFAAFVCASAGMREYVEIKPRAENILAEIAVRVGFFDGSLHDVQHVAIFAANVNEAAMRSKRTPGDNHALDQLMRIHFHQRTVFARARFGFVGIANQVFRLRRIFRHERPLHSGRKARTTAPAQTGFFHFVDDRLRRHLLQRFFERLVAVVLQIDIDLAGILDAPASADERRFSGFSRMKRAGSDRFRRRNPCRRPIP